MNKQKILQLYRSFFRIQKEIFLNDNTASKRAIEKIRKDFRNFQNEKDLNKINELINNAELTISFLQKNVIQAVFNPSKNVYGKLKKNNNFFNILRVKSKIIYRHEKTINIYIFYNRIKWKYLFTPFYLLLIYIYNIKENNQALVV